jgi:hypothetical protein
MLGFAPLASTTFADIGQGLSYHISFDSGSYTVTGNDVNAATSITAGEATFTLTGQTSPLVVTKPADEATFTLTGQDIDFTVQDVLTAAHVNYIMTPQDADAAWKRVAGAGTFSLTGQVSGINYALEGGDTSYTLSGQTSVFEVTLLAGEATYDLTGQAANTNTSISHNVGSFSVTGQEVAISPTTVITVDAAGSFTLTGQDLNFDVQDNFVADEGTFTVTGQNVIVATSIAHAEGSFALTGQDAGLVVAEQLPVDSVTYTITGQDVNFDVSDNFVAEAGAFIVGGEDVSLKVNYPLVLTEPYLFNLAEQDADLIKGRSLVAEGTTYSITTEDAVFTPEITLPATRGVFSVSGQDLALIFPLSVDEGTFTLTGPDITISNPSSRRGVLVTGKSFNKVTLIKGYNKVA